MKKSKAKKNKLAALVLSLNLNEKRSFRKLHQGNSDYLLLFDFIDKHKVYDNQQFNAFLRKKGRQKRYTPGGLSVLRKYLYDKLLEFLRKTYAEKNVLYELLTTAINIDILIDKGLHEEAHALLEKSLEEIPDYMFPIEQLILLRRQSILNYYAQYKYQNEEDIIYSSSRRRELVNLMLREVNYAETISLQSFDYHQGKLRQERLQQLLESDFMAEAPKIKTPNDYLYYWIKSHEALNKDNVQEAFNYFCLCLKTWHERPKMIQSYTMMYLGTCYSFMTLLSNPQVLNFGKCDLLTVDKLLYPLDTDALTSGELELYWEVYFLLQMLFGHKNKDYSRILELKEEVMKYLKNSDSDFSHFIFSFYPAIANFHLGEFQKAQGLINAVVFDKQLAKRFNQKFLVAVELLNLLIHFELGNYTFLKSKIRNTSIFLKNMNHLGHFEKSFLSLIRNLIGVRYKNRLLDVFLNFQEGIKGTPDNDSYMILDLGSWLDQKILSLNSQVQ